MFAPKSPNYVSVYDQYSLLKVDNKPGKLLDFEIYFLKDRNIQKTASYNPGDEIQAMCVVECSGHYFVNAIAIVIRGRVRTDFYKGSGIYKRRHHQEFYYFLYKHFLYGPVFDVRSGYLQDGRHDFIFRFKLPECLPSSFTHRFGKISYCIKAMIIKPNRNATIKKRYFNVVALIDLSNPELTKPVIRKTRMLAYSNCLPCCCCRSGFLTILAATDKTAYILGDVIHITTYFENYLHSSVVPRAKLYEILIFYASEKYKVRKTGVKSYLTTAAIPGRSRIQWKADLNIPKYHCRRRLYCSLLNCPYIRVGYFVRVSLCDCHVDLPIIVDDFGLKTMYCIPVYRPISPVKEKVNRFV